MTALNCRLVNLSKFLLNEIDRLGFQLDFYMKRKILDKFMNLHMEAKIQEKQNTEKSKPKPSSKKSFKVEKRKNKGKKKSKKRQIQPLYNEEFMAQTILEMAAFFSSHSQFSQGPK